MLGVYNRGFTPLLVLIALSPDHTKVEVKALPVSIEEIGMSANRLPSGSCAYASNGVG